MLKECYPKVIYKYPNINHDSFIKILKRISMKKNRGLYIDLAVDYQMLPDGMVNAQISLTLPKNT